MTQTIEQLTARVRELETQLAANNPLLDEAANRIDELEEENARLRFALADTEALELGTSERLAAIKAENESLKRDAEQWRAYQKRKQDLLDRGFLRSPLRADELDATAQGEKG